ncbi:hypothetical protein [Chitinibacter sp. GC72]|uniref:hypothetical protein n=1 Tax=Chitinibacter sp. GC72 TaxID=1526917 RepID=UPI0012FAC4E7|nr:hypothetical protein [Chitinibacter sp. GC72]
MSLRNCAIACFALLAISSQSAMATNPNDGIYDCNMGFGADYISLNSRDATGVLVMLEPASGDSNGLAEWWYVIGSWINEQQLNGKTQKGGNFSANVNNGVLQLRIDMKMGNGFQPFDLTCNKVI